MEPLATAWVILQFSTLISVILGILLGFRDYSYQLLPLYVSTALSLLVLYCELRSSLPVNALFFNRLFLNYSFHVIGVNVALILSGRSPIAWVMVIGITSFHHALTYLINYYFPTKPASSLSSTLTNLHKAITEPPLAEGLVASFEIFGLLPTFPSTFIKVILLFAFYLFWFVLFRYATSHQHRQIWHEYALKFTVLANKLPPNVREFVLPIPEKLGKLGDIAMSIYGASSRVD